MMTMRAELSLVPRPLKVRTIWRDICADVAPDDAPAYSTIHAAVDTAAPEFTWCARGRSMKEWITIEQLMAIGLVAAHDSAHGQSPQTEFAASPVRADAERPKSSPILGRIASTRYPREARRHRGARSHRNSNRSRAGVQRYGDSVAGAARGTAPAAEEKAQAARSRGPPYLSGHLT